MEQDGHYGVRGASDSSRVANGYNVVLTPDLFIVTGPGTTLGGAVAQSLILADWQGMGSKEDFQGRQASDPLLVSMGMEDQRASVS